MGFERVPAATALAGSSATASSKWPNRANAPRLHPYALPAISPGFKLIPGESIFTIGSCFARHIEQALRARGFGVPALGFQVPGDELWAGTVMKSGILNKYTPHSMLNELRFAFGDEDGGDFLLPVHGDQVIDAQLHTNVAVGRGRAIERRQQVRQLYRNAVEKCRVVIVTLGLVEAWWDQRTGIYMNETPTRAILDANKDNLYFEVLSPEAVSEAVNELLVLMKHHGMPEQRVLLTVSPVPIARSFSGDDAITANCYSKSVLRAAAEVAKRKFDWVDYYPSYESITHSSRERVWEDDQIHVRKEAVAANVNRMVEVYS